MVGRSRGYMLSALLLALVLLTGCPDDGADLGAKPEARFEAAISAGFAPLTVEFYDNSAPGASAIYQWSWDFGDYTTSTERNPRHTYYLAGNYTVTLRVTTALGVGIKTVPNCIVITDPIQVVGIDATGGALEAFDGKLTVPPGAFGNRVILGMSANETDMPTNLAESELLVSTVYSIQHDRADFRVDPRNPLLVELPFFQQMVPLADRTSEKLYLFAKLQNGARIPIIGNVADGRFTAPIAGLPTRAAYAVVYRPRAVINTVAIEEPLKTPTSYRWFTNAWQLSYSPAMLQALTALDLGNPYIMDWFNRRDWPAGTIRATENALRESVADIHEIAQTAGLISPSLHVTPQNEYKLLFYQMKQQPLSDFTYVGETLYATSLFGSIVIDPEQLVAISKRQAGASDDGFQELEFPHAFAEELFRSIFRGYDLPAFTTAVTPEYGLDRRPVNVPFSLGFNEGLAIYMSQLATGETTYRPSGPGYIEIYRARAFSSNEYALLSDPLFLPASPRRPAYASATQDFFFYLTNKFAPNNPLEYIADSYDGVLEMMRVGALAPSVTNYNRAAEAARKGVDNALRRVFDRNLPQVYWDYARARAYENPNDSKLRPSDLGRNAFTINSDRFESQALLQSSFSSFFEQTFSYADYPRLKNIPPLTTVAIVLTAQNISCDLKIAVNAYDWDVDSYGNSMRVKVYKNGFDGVELTPQNSETVLTGFSNTLAFKKAVILITNVSMEEAYSAIVTATPRPRS